MQNAEIAELDKMLKAAGGNVTPEFKDLADKCEQRFAKDAREYCVRLIGELARSEREAGGPLAPARDALTAGLDALAVFRRLWAGCPDGRRSELREAYAAVLAAVDEAASRRLDAPGAAPREGAGLDSAPPGGALFGRADRDGRGARAPGAGTPDAERSGAGRSELGRSGSGASAEAARTMLDALAKTDPSLERALLDAALDAVVSWGAGPDPKPFWPAAARGALAKRALRRLGGGAARYLGAPPGARAAPPVGEGASQDLAAFLKDHGAAADRAIAVNALRLWRARFEEALAARRAREERDGPRGAGAALLRAGAEDPFDPTPLSPQPSEAAHRMAVDALARIVDEAALSEHAEADAAGLIGADALWTLRQFIDLGRDPKTRAPHARAPETIRGAWAQIAYAADRNDLFSSEMFFLFLACRLTAQGAQAIEAGGKPDPVSEPFLAHLTEAHVGQRTAVGVLTADSRVALRGFLWQRPGGEERAQAIDALPDAAIAERLDRALLFLALAALDESGAPMTPPLSRLWSPLRIGPKDLERLHPPKRLHARLTRFLHPPDPAMTAAAHRHYRASLEKVVLQSLSLNRFAVWRTLLFGPARTGSGGA